MDDLDIDRHGEYAPALRAAIDWAREELQSAGVVDVDEDLVCVVALKRLRQEIGPERYAEVRREATARHARHRRGRANGRPALPSRSRMAGLRRVIRRLDYEAGGPTARDVVEPVSLAGAASR